METIKRIPFVGKQQNAAIRQAMADAHAGATIQGAFGQNMSPISTIPGSRFIAPPINKSPYQTPIIAMITTTGPAGEANYTDERYWIKSQYLKQTYSQDGDYETTAAMLGDETADITYQATWQTATNLAEAANHTHFLPSGTIVQILPIAGALSGAELSDLVDPSNPFANAYIQYIITGVLGINGVIPVYVKWVGGSDGSPPSTAASWTYDVYASGDFTNKLNLAGALNPKCSRARIVNASTIKAQDGTVAIGYYDRVGAIQLFDLQEFLVQNSCTTGSGGSSPSFMGV